MLAYFYMHHMSWGWGLLMGIGWVAVWALVIFGVVSLVRDRRSPAAPTDVLKQRLARGEISLEEYEDLRRAVTGPPAPPAAPPSAPA